MNQSDDSINQTTDVAIIGAGPIGLELAAAFKEAGVNYLHFEARQIGHTMTWWPRNTSFFSTTERIEIAGIPAPSTTQGRITGEEYLAYLRGVVEQLDLQIKTYEPVVDIQQLPDGFHLRTVSQRGEHNYFAAKVVLANGDMDFPNRLEIPGEDLPHVSHYFTDPHMYFRKRLLIVGGRNSAVEAALRCWRAGVDVSVSYRRDVFDLQMVKHWLLPDLLTQISHGNITFYPNTLPVEITKLAVTLSRLHKGQPTGGKPITIPADFVFLATGYRADTRLFELAGVELVGEECAPLYHPDTMETNVPGLYVAGTSVGGSQSRYRVFIENSHEHVGKIVYALTGKWPAKIGSIPGRRYDLPLEAIQSN
jgi:thioredoxin reductase (NADPH)